MTKTQFHPPHKTVGGAHSFSINDDGTEVMLTFQGQPSIVISGADAKDLGSWLAGAALRTQLEADQLAQDVKANPPKESSGIPRPAGQQGPG